MAISSIDFDRLLKLHLLVARFGERDAARRWNTGDAGRETAVLGRARSLRRFPQGRIVFEVAPARRAEVFDHPSCITLCHLPTAIEDQFDARWARWLEDRATWTDYFAVIERPPSEILGTLKKLSLANEQIGKRVSSISPAECLADALAAELPPGTGHTASVSGDGAVGLYRVDLSPSFGNGKLKLAAGVRGNRDVRHAAFNALRLN